MISGSAFWLALITVLLQLGFGALEIFCPRWVFDQVFPSYYDTQNSPVWSETEKLARNMGLYNWFLAVGLLASLWWGMGGASTAQFFLSCVAVAGVFGLLSVGWSRAFVAQLIFGIVPLVLSCKFS
jgi:uncharacterized membrane protein